MHLFTPSFILAASCFFLHLKSLLAAPVEEIVKVIQVRQEIDDGLDPNDYDGGQIGDPLRNAYDYSRAYTANHNPTWYTILQVNPTTGTYLVHATGNPKPTLPPRAVAEKQGDQFNVDHVLELQVVIEFIRRTNPNPAFIRDASWNYLRDVVTYPVAVRSLAPSPASQRVAIASAIGSFNNLAGIPNIPNVSKGKFFNGALNPNPYTVDSRVPRYFRDANRKYLEDRKGGLQGVIDNIGTQLGTAGAGKTGTLEYQAIADAWGTFARAIYQDVINRLASR